MLGRFTKSFPDETLHSWCTRESELMEYASMAFFLEDLFGPHAHKIAIDFPNRLDFFVASLPRNHFYPVDRLINEHTLLPFYAPFLPSERLNRLREDMCVSKVVGIKRRAGISKQKPLKTLRLCPSCVQEDRRKYGVCYWHRVHQIPGVLVCPTHCIPLQDSSVLVSGITHQYKLISAEQVVQTSSLESTSFVSCHETLVKIAQDAAWLLQQNNLISNPDNLFDRYIYLLADRSLAAYTGKIHIQRLLKEFQNYYAADLLEQMERSLDFENDYNWLTRLLISKRQVQDPIHHLLLIHFLGYTAETFFSLALEPFGEKPWPCLNHASEHYLQPLVEDLSIHYQGIGKRPVGTFSCSCGFTYVRTGPDRSSEDRFRIGMVKSYGEVWEKLLKRLYEDPTMILEKAAFELGVAPSTVIKHASQLELLPLEPPTPLSIKLSEYRAKQLQNPQPKSSRRKVDKQKYREEYLLVKEQTPNCTRSDFIRKIPAIYNYLLANDKEWLSTEQPQIQHEPSKLPKPLLVDWEKRDMQVASEVRSAAIQLKNVDGRPVRITKTAICNMIGQAPLVHDYLHKLPLTDQAFTEVVETTEEHSVRRIWWVVKRCREENILPIRGQFIRWAGVLKTRDHPLIKQAIDEAFRVLTQMDE